MTFIRVSQLDLKGCFESKLWTLARNYTVDIHLLENLEQAQKFSVIVETDCVFCTSLYCTQCWFFALQISDIRLGSNQVSFHLATSLGQLIVVSQIQTL